MKMERLREIAEKVGAHADGERMYVTFIAGTEKLWLSVWSATQERYAALEEILAEHRDEFLVVENRRSRDWSLDADYLNRIDFLDLSRRMASGIQADLRALMDDPPPSPLYAFAVATSPEHRSVETRANSEAEWRKRAPDGSGSKRTDRDAYKYLSPEFTLTHTKAAGEHWEPLYEALKKVDKIVSEHFDLTDGSAWFDQGYERRFTQMAVRALKANAYLLDELHTTPDFVAYVQDPVGGGDDFFTALETVPLERVRTMYPQHPAASAP